MVLPTGTSEESNSNPQNGWVLESLDLQGLMEWPDPKLEQASCAQEGHSKGMPWWGLPSRSEVHARPHVWLVLLAQHGCPGEGTHWQVSSMPYLQSQAAQGPTGKHCGHTSLRELVHLDDLCLEPRAGLEEKVLVVTDHFTWYMVPKPRLPRQPPKPCGTSSLSTMGCLKRSSWIRVEIFSQLVADLCKLMGTQKL